MHARTLVSVSAVALVTLLGVSACSDGGPDKDTKASAAVVDRPLPTISQATLAARGTVVSSEPFTGLPASVAGDIGQIRRVVYRSVSAYDGASSQVSGVVMIPRGKAPEGGWPILSYGHPTVGLANDCGPSLRGDLLGFASALAAVAKSGYAVAFTDYQGLGHPGRHPYLEPRTAGFNMIDVTRALRTVFPQTSTTWLAVGSSQGGQAAWAANEYAGDYGAGLKLAGSVSISPPADIVGFAQRARDQTLTPDQTVFMPLVVEGLAVSHPELKIADYLRGNAASGLQTISSCNPSRTAQKDAINRSLDAAQVRPDSDAATEALASALREDSLPQRRASAPMLVINGSEDKLVLPAWVESAVGIGCASGDRILHREMKGQGHSDASAGDEMYTWMVERFQGKSAPTNCE